MTLTCKQAQSRMVEVSRAESFLDRSVPLGYPPIQTWGWVEAGVTIGEYYRSKHQGGRFGKFYGLHVCQTGKQQEKR